MLCGLEMLRQIPFPAQLGRVTEIAAGHHETLTGTGYPLKKTKDQLPVEARILAVADIFEALTASDRPYKKAKPLSEALRIMSRMRDDSHIDADIFDIFLTRGVFRIYAENHLDPSQCDVTDVTPYLSQPNAA
jgi:HD-GYP domain-containing protein (c-di-GMP phosphodiesterase class II)